MTSAFGAFFMFLLGILIQNGYQFIGEWYEKEPPHTAPTEEQVKTASRNCFIVGGVYLGWVVFAAACVCVQGARAKRA
jgi:hypothetical protein